MPILQLLNKSFGVYNIKGFYIEPTYWEAGAIVFLIFLLLLTLARVRYLYIHWSLGKNAFSLFFWGFLLALIIEGFFIIGGKTIVTEIIGWKNAPKPISTVLDFGREKLVDVLGVSEEISQSQAASTPSASTVVSDFQSLSASESQKAKEAICKP